MEQTFLLFWLYLDPSDNRYYCRNNRKMVAGPTRCLAIRYWHECVRKNLKDFYYHELSPIPEFPEAIRHAIPINYTLGKAKNAKQYIFPEGLMKSTRVGKAGLRRASVKMIQKKGKQVDILSKPDKEPKEDE